MQQNQIFTSPYVSNGSIPIMDQTYRPQQQFQENPMQQYRQQSTIMGRVVENIDTVRAIEIPMDGNPYYFPKADGVEIYTKRWLNNGSTQVLRYVLKTDEEQEAEDNLLLNKLNSIEEQIQKLASQRQNTYHNKPNKPNKANYERRNSE